MSLLFTPGNIAARRRGWVDPLAGIPFGLRLQTHRGDGVPLGIDPTDGVANETWQGLVSSVSQSVSTKRFTTAYESGMPVLASDGVDDLMLSPIASSTLDASGFLVATFRPVGAYFYGTPVSGTFGGPAIASIESNSEWGLGRPGNYSAQQPFNIPNSEWRTVISSWSGTSFRSSIISPSLTDSKSGTLPSAFDAEPGFVGLAVHGTDAPYSFFSARYVAVAAGAAYLSLEDMQRIAEYFQSLAPL